MKMTPTKKILMGIIVAPVLIPWEFITLVMLCSATACAPKQLIWALWLIAFLPVPAALALEHHRLRHWAWGMYLAVPLGMTGWIPTLAGFGAIGLQALILFYFVLRCRGFFVEEKTGLDAPGWKNLWNR